MRKIIAIATIVIIVAFAVSGTVATCTSQAAQNAGLSKEASDALGSAAETTLDTAASGWQMAGNAFVDWWNTSSDMIIGYTTDAVNNLFANIADFISGTDSAKDTNEP